MSSRSRWRSRSRSADLTLVSDRAVSQIGAGRSMLVNLVPEFLAVLAAPDPAAAYSEYLYRHVPVLTSYWQNYVLDPASPHAEQRIAAALRTDRADLRRLVADLRGHYDYWDTGSRATLRELLVNEGAAVAAAQAVAPGFEPWEYFGYTRRQYRRIRELDAFLRRVTAATLDETGLGLRLRFLTGGLTPAARLMGGKVLPERAGYYLGLRLVENYLAERGIASTLRAAAAEFRQADDRALGIQTA